MSRQDANAAFALSSFLHGANATWIDGLYARYEKDPASVDPEWQEFFKSLKDPPGDILKNADGPSWARDNWPLSPRDDLTSALDGNWAEVEKIMGGKIAARAQARGVEPSTADVHQATRDSIRALMLIRAYRMRGHFHAKLDPLGLEPARDHEELDPRTYGFVDADLDRKIFLDHVLGLDYGTLREIVAICERTYCQTLGVEFMHISNGAQKAWIQERIEGPDKEISFTPEGRRAILMKLIEAEGFEKFCDLKFTGTKRFGLDGGESLIPAIERIIKRGGNLGVKEIVLGMPHRGRLNVLTQVMGKPHRALFHEFKGGSVNPDAVEGSGDVKYHLGASSDREFDSNKVHLSLTANPSHLEIVDPVVLGKVRAKQDQHGDPPDQRISVLPLLMHGDAAFAGQGVVAECFSLSDLKGYRTGGSLHFIVNNQIGFTTYPRYSRSSPYPSDVAKMIDAPIFHVNGDDPDADPRRGVTGVDLAQLKDIGRKITKVPDGFHVHRTVQRFLENRAKAIENGAGIDWATGEALAFCTLLEEGHHVRLSGQDSERGTFSQRHSVLIDQEDETRYTPFKHLKPDQGRYEVINSLLSEEAVVGFEYGYSLAEPLALTVWEAQFGDFANGAQVLFDQFISSGERKWLRMSGLVCMLPHGYEGQGPEHSSARLERFLQMCAEDNMQVVHPTTPANFFHVLRRQLHREIRKPLILMTPKSLLRHKRAVSRLEEFGANTTFHRILYDDAVMLPEEKIKLVPDSQIRRVVLCSGKVYYDLYDEREKRGVDDVYLMRVEQLYPVPLKALVQELGRFKGAELVWCQEEPRNMGAWHFMEPYLEWVLNQIHAPNKRPRYAGRAAAAATATGLMSKHLAQLKALLDEALS